MQEMRGGGTGPYGMKIMQEGELINSGMIVEILIWVMGIFMLRIF